MSDEHSSDMSEEKSLPISADSFKQMVKEKLLKHPWYKTILDNSSSRTELIIESDANPDYVIWDPKKWDNPSVSPQAGFCDQKSIITMILFHIRMGQCVTINLGDNGIMLVYYDQIHKELRLFPSTIGLRKKDGRFDFDPDHTKVVTISGSL